MSSAEEVERFLETFKTKLGIWGLYFRKDRAKNLETLLDLEFSISKVKDVLGDLTLKDFVEGPLPDELNLIAELWVFGREIKMKEVYIKISIGSFGREVICISFHFAEYPLNYPFNV